MRGSPLISSPASPDRTRRGLRRDARIGRSQRTRRGLVYLVGAGPGDPKLITVRGLECLRRADVVVYDRLVSRALLDETRPEAELIYAGKAAGSQSLRQDEINRILIDRARGGLTVVRLKGGDPFVFGRGGEEALACAAAGVRWEVVPGVSSAIGVPGGAAIPVTHRGVAGSFAVVTAHRAGEGKDDPDWGALARIDTLAVLMGVERLAGVAASLMAHGRHPRTPVAIIERGTMMGERITTGTLANIAARAKLVGLRSPATIVIGEVVSLRRRLKVRAPRLGRRSVRFLARSRLLVRPGSIARRILGSPHRAIAPERPPKLVTSRIGARSPP